MATRTSSRSSKAAPRRRRRPPPMPAPLGPPPPVGISVEDHESVLRLTQTLFLKLDLGGRVAVCSGAWEDCLHRTCSDIVGRPLLDLVTPADRDACRVALQRALAGHPAEEHAVRFEGNGRGSVWLALRPLINATHDGLNLVARDITAEKINADEPPPAELVLDELEEGVLIADATRPGLPILYANSGFARLTGYTPAEARNRPLTFLTCPHTDMTSLEAAISAAFRGEHAQPEVCLRRRDGAMIWIRLHLRPSANSEGEIRHLIAIHVDVSERRLVSEALREKSAALAEALESLQKTKEVIVQRERMHALGKMASGIVHDFNNLLAPILGFTELMLSIPELINDPEKVATYLQKIRTAANDGASVVSRLREFYRSRSDAEPAMEFSPQEAIREVLELTRHRWENEAQGAGLLLDVRTEFEETAPIYGSASEIRQVLTNLVLNAVDAMPQGGTLRLRTYAVGNWVCVQVADSGTGMPEEVRRRCFEPFFTTKGKAGTGLGLAIVFGIVERHHGRVDLQTGVGTGTTFTLWFPASNSANAAADGSSPLAVEGGRPLRVMVVDDEDLLLEVMSQHLLNMGHSVDCFTSPKDALDHFFHHPCDIVFTDRAMPGMAGDQLARLLREYRADTPIILLTGFGNIIKQTGETVENIDEVLPKPVSHQKLREVLARHGGRCASPADGNWQ